MTLTGTSDSDEQGKVLLHLGISACEVVAAQCQL